MSRAVHVVATELLVGLGQIDDEVGDFSRDAVQVGHGTLDGADRKLALAAWSMKFRA